MKGLRWIILAIFVFLLLTNRVSCQTKRCDTVDQCSCKFEDGTVVDLTSLGNTDNTPRFKDLSSEEGNYYSYNPCKGFTEKSCSAAATCILNSDKSESIQIGDANNAAFAYNTEEDAVVVAYTSGTIRDLRLSEVILKCDQSACSPTVVANGAQDAGEFKYTLTSVCACPDGCTSKGPKNCGGGSGGGASGLSIGSAICITLFSFLILYLVVGAIFMKFVKKKEGAEVIPNLTFWRSVPVLVKNGGKFATNTVLRRKDATYDSI
ncbi:uncharacterized protein LOC128240840 [Mya arenaria]|uniref:uncharacterized protein LOC128240829 n=1 Tax=Mya arenaria TaxID=6604 RepID=UPI0022DF0C86|nr:uncharacterized protein LOC128240829 [Mya arenaria]XP_052813732.1 uncharacterized protein LOC128240840 [Mya arenaria]